MRLVDQQTRRQFPDTTSRAGGRDTKIRACAKRKQPFELGVDHNFSRFGKVGTNWGNFCAMIEIPLKLR